MLQNSKTWIFLAQVPLAWEWFKAGWDKITEGGLGADFANSLGMTLGFFEKSKSAAGKIIVNPNDWYVNSFLAMAKNNSQAFGYLVEYGEFLLGITLFVAIIYYFVTRKALPTLLVWLAVIGLVGGFFLNFNFYFAAGWSNVSTNSVNLVMGLMELVFIGYYVFSERAKN